MPDTPPRLLAVSVGGPRDHEWQGKPVRTSIFTSEVPGRADRPPPEGRAIVVPRRVRQGRSGRSGRSGRQARSGRTFAQLAFASW